MIGTDTTFLVQIEVIELPAHRSACEILQQQIIGSQLKLSLAPQVLAEFIHVVTDPKRFSKPLSPQEALAKASFWWQAAEVQQVFPSPDATKLFLRWMKEFQLGRKRILDTQLAATLWTAGVRRLITSNPSDFELFGFEVIIPSI